MLVVIGRCQLWPKHVMSRHFFSLQAFTMFVSLSVAIAATNIYWPTNTSSVPNKQARKLTTSGRGAKWIDFPCDTPAMPFFLFSKSGVVNWGYAWPPSCQQDLEALLAMIFFDQAFYKHAKRLAERLIHSQWAYLTLGALK